MKIAHFRECLVAL